MRKKSRRRVGVLLFIAVVLAAGCVIGFWAARRLPSHVAPTSLGPSVSESAFQQRIDAADAALRGSLAAMGKGPAEVLSHSPHRHSGREFDFRTLRLPQCDHGRLRHRITRELAANVPGARLSTPSTREWRIYIDGTQTHKLLLPALPVAPPPEAKAAMSRQPKVAGAKLALVIDDMGENVRFAHEAAALDIPITFSIWPDSSRRKAVLKIARANGCGILIHLPMQPVTYPRVNPGRNALLVRMPPAEIRALTLQAIAHVPGALGVNNHEGSAFTENAPDMHVALEAMKEHGLFFLDSLTTPHSAGRRETKMLGMRYYVRDVFLDNVRKPAAIIKQLREAEAIARRRGQAVAIGHPHPATMAALQQWLKTRDASVHLVFLATLRSE